MKTCFRCKISKPYECFSRHRRYSDGRRGTCKPCDKLAQSSYNITKPDPEKERIRDRARYGREKERRRAAVATYKARHPERVKEKDRRRRINNRDALNAYTAKHKADKLRARPPWANLKAIRDFYREAVRLTQETGVLYSVDHIIPLRSKIVCGLHIPANLRCITHSENSAKQNRFDPLAC